MRVLPVISLALLLSAESVPAQEETVSLDFNVLLWAPFETLPPGVPEPEEPDLWYFDGEEPVRTGATCNVPTNALPYEGPPELSFAVPSGPRPVDGGPPPLRTVLRLPVTGDASHLLLLFFQTEDGGMRVFPVDVGIDDMPDGSLKLINYGGEAIVAKVGGKTQTMAQGDSWIVPASEAKNFQLRMQLAARQDDQWRLIYRTSFAVSDKDIRMVFLIHRKDIDSGPWRVRPIAGFDRGTRETEAPDTEAMAEDYQASGGR